MAADKVIVWCLLIDHEKKAIPGDAFAVEVSPRVNVDNLKKKIKEEKPIALKHIDPSSLIVWGSEIDFADLDDLDTDELNEKLKWAFSSEKTVKRRGPKREVARLTDRSLLIEVPEAGSATLHRPVTPESDTGTQRMPFGWHSETDEKWRNFYKFWRTQNFDEVFKRPIIPLAYDKIGLDDTSHRLKVFANTHNQLYVRQAYRDMFDRVVEFGRNNNGLGLVISGQPGIGKTMWLWFALICLIMKKEPVAFHSVSTTRLFYNEDIICTKDADMPNTIDGIIWSLIDVDTATDTPPPHLVMRGVFPIQSSSPSKTRYGRWLRQRNGYMWGMPLWSRDELREGIKLHEEYEPTLELLKHALEDLSSAQKSPHKPVILKALEYKESCHSGPNDNRAEQLLMMVLDEAIKKYGEAPRHVWTSVFSGFGDTEQRIEAALTGLSGRLDAFPDSLSRLGEIDDTSKEESLSHQIISLEVRSCGQQMMNDDFLPKFRSIEVGERVMTKFRFLQFNQAQRLVDLYRKLPESSSLAGWIFESIAHERLRSGQSLDYLYEMQEMQDNGSAGKKVPAHISFQFDPMSKPSDTRLPTRERVFVPVDFTDDKFRPESQLKLEQSYCVPQVRNNPLFDSFLVEFGEEAKVTVWIFQKTLSPSHGGSEKGFVRIRSIIEAAQAREKALAVGKRKRSSEVEVKYVLLCPAFDSGIPKGKRTWNIPANGWTSSVKGLVYCLFVNVEQQQFNFCNYGPVSRFFLVIDQGIRRSRFRIQPYYASTPLFRFPLFSDFLFPYLPHIRSTWKNSRRCISTS